MSVIYTPKGKAREYSPYACNIYIGCNHGCKYCYAPSIRFTTREKYLVPVPRREHESTCLEAPKPPRADLNEVT